MLPPHGVWVTEASCNDTSQGAEAIHTDAQRILVGLIFALPRLNHFIGTTQNRTLFHSISVCYICNSLIVVHKKIFKTLFGVMYLYENKTVQMQMLHYIRGRNNIYGSQQDYLVGKSGSPQIYVVVIWPRFKQNNMTNTKFDKYSQYFW